MKNITLLFIIHKNELSTYNKSIGCSKKMLNINKKLEKSDLNNYEQLIEQILKIIKKLEK